MDILTICSIVVAILVLPGVLILFLRPSFTLKLIVWFLRHTFLRLRIEGVENIPDSGPVLLVSNHVSLIDMLLIQSISRRPVRFMVRQEILDFVPTRFLFWYLGVIRVPSISHPKAMHRFFLRVRGELRRGGVLCLFPEGSISGNGGLMRFRSGVGPLLPAGVEVSVIPVRIGMLWGRLFTLHNGRLKYRPPLTLPLNFSLKVGRPASPALSAFELRQLISELGAEAEAAPQPGELPLHVAFAKRAKRHPFEVTYLDANGTKCSNFEMLVRAAILSRRVRELKSESRYIGVLLPNCTAMTAAMFGVLFADRTPAVVNFSAGAEVALDSLRRAGVESILTSRKFLRKLNWSETPEMVILEDVAAQVTPAEKRQTALLCALMPFRMLMRRLAPRSAFNVGLEAVLLFSSGSTGKPKAVQLTHRNINCDLWAFWRMILWSRRDRIVGNLPLFHAYGFTVEFAFPALSGTPVIYLPNPLDAAGVVKAIETFGITLLTATPTFLQGYLRKATPAQLKTLRLVITGAEKLRPELAAKFRDMTGLEIIEGYGCTELSPIVTINLCNSIYLLGKRAHHPGSIGIPLPGIHVRVVDPESGVELGPDSPGLMQVKSGTVMKGYLNDPEQTARVIQNGYYNTGDIARIDREGYVYITGRASRFSKIGGEMVPHELVEQAIAALRGREEREVAVTGRPDPKRGERLVVFYTADDFDPAALIEGLRAEKLPNLWIPKAEDFVKIDHLPLLGSGKLDLTRLKKLAEELA
ncbi:AMP-binding protein [uncultured Victivallis sp.]|uniref:AMP-binding protein n=1 Tax=uncultured Victivallis sp. TaxID=354118 RepID=UPI0025F653EC|nr:AMP-binding protein [uncultured Victivallis sp.]